MGLFSFTQEIAIDLGTANTIIMCDDKVVVDEPSVVAISMADNKMVADLVDLDKDGYIIADETCKTKTEGLFVAGDCRTKPVRQVITALADGAVAATNASIYLEKLANEN